MSTDSRRTPYDDAYPTCERTDVCLQIYGEKLVPAEVTSILGLSPTDEQTAGQSIVSSRGRSRTPKTGGWFLSSEGRVHSKDVRRHLDWLIELLQPRATGLRRLQATPGVRMYVNCIWWSSRGIGGPTLWPEQMGALADLNLECSFDVSFYGPDDDEAPN